MNKKILFSLSLLTTVLSANAQSYDEQINPSQVIPKKFNASRINNKSTAVTGDNSYYYWENNSRVTKELNTHLGTTDGNDGGFDTLGLYVYKVKFKTSTNGDYWQQLIQGIPTKDTLTLNGLDLIGSSLNAAGSNVLVKVYKKDLTTLLGSKTVTFSNTYGFQSVLFDTPIESLDTMLISLEMATVADSFEVARSHNMWNGYDFGAPVGVFNSALPFVGDAAILAVQPNNAGILGLIQDNFDFFVIPNFTYNLNANFSASDLEFCLGDSVSFVNSANTFHVKNPILNYIEWDLLANASPVAYTTYDFGNGTAAIYSDNQESGVVYQTAGNFTVSASAFMWPWSSQTPTLDTKTFNIIVTDCSAGLNEINNSTISIYPNPTKNNVTINTLSKGTVVLSYANGKVIETRNIIDGQETIDVSNLSSGLYFINFSNNDGSITTKLIIE